MGMNAAAIWLSHGGKLDQSDFELFVYRIIDNAGFGPDEEDAGSGPKRRKARVSASALVRQVRQKIDENGPPIWRLF